MHNDGVLHAASKEVFENTLGHGWYDFMPMSTLLAEDSSFCKESEIAVGVHLCFNNVTAKQNRVLLQLTTTEHDCQVRQSQRCF